MFSAESGRACRSSVRVREVGDRRGDDLGSGRLALEGDVTDEAAGRIHSFFHRPPSVRRRLDEEDGALPRLERGARQRATSLPQLSTSFDRNLSRPSARPALVRAPHARGGHRSEPLASRPCCARSTGRNARPRRFSEEERGGRCAAAATPKRICTRTRTPSGCAPACRGASRASSGASR